MIADNRRSKKENMLQIFKLLMVLQCLHIPLALLEERDAIVNLPNLGLIQGKIIETAWTEREVLQFVDVKYAESPSDKHRSRY